MTKNAKEFSTIAKATCSATARLLAAMLRRGHIDLPRALFRGRYAPALTHMQKVGVPIDQNRFELLKRNEESVKKHLLQTLGAHYDDVYDDKGGFGERQVHAPSRAPGLELAAFR